MKQNGSPYPMHPRRSAVTISENPSCEAVSTEPSSPACGAKTRDGSPCRNLPMRNGRCRMHGGASTGRKTAAGIASHRAAVTIHGGRSQEMVEFRRQMRELRAEARKLVELA